MESLLLLFLLWRTTDAAIFASSSSSSKSIFSLPLARGLGDVLQQECSSHRDCWEGNGLEEDGGGEDLKKGVVCDSRLGRCRCRRHFYSSSSGGGVGRCLPGQLLTFPCSVDAQCRGRVQHSICLGGRCQCRRGTVAFRRHTCVKGASLGSICYSDSQCHLSDQKSFCAFVIRGVFGRCVCLHGRMEQDQSRCKEEFDEIGSTCHRPGPCTGLPNSVCFPDLATGQARCRCSPGHFPLGRKVCFSLSKAASANNEVGGGVKERHKASPSLLSYVLSPPASASSASAQAKPVSLGKKCTKDEECQAADKESVCGPSGVCACAAFDGGSLFGRRRKRWRRRKRASSSSVRANGLGWYCQERSLRLCPKGTFQCRSSGRCVSRYFLCDGRPHCEDGSDEDCSGDGTYDGSFECPEGSFQCRGKGRRTKCLAVAKVCDGREDCPNGEDEDGCLRSNTERRNVTSCHPSTFACSDGSGCVPGFELCNARPACPDSSDEEEKLCLPPRRWGRRRRRMQLLRPFLLRHSSSSSSDEDDPCPFRCSNGHCRSPDVLCSGEDGCGDGGSDESMCHICKCPPR